MSSAFHCRPSSFFGFTSPDETWLAYQIDRAVFTFGSWIKNRIEETIRVPASKNKNEPLMETKAKWSSEQIQSFIYDPLPDPDLVAAHQNEPSGWGNIDPFAVTADSDRPIPSKYKQGRTIMPHEMTN